MKFQSIIFFLLTISIVACSSSKTTAYKSSNSNSSYTSGRSLVKFEKNQRLSTVLAAAKRSNKPVFIDFYTSWCGPCKMMDKEVFSDRSTADMLNRNFINYKVNAEKDMGPDLATLYNVGSFPTLLFLDEDGKVLLRHEGMAYEETMKNIARTALEINRSLVSN